MNKLLIIGLIAVVAIAGIAYYAMQTPVEATPDELSALDDSLSALDETPDADNYSEFVPQDGF